MTKTPDNSTSNTTENKDPKTPFKWSDSSVGILQKMWGKGSSAAEIAGMIGHGVTRNAVIGKAHRLGLKAAAPAKQKEHITILDLTDRICRWPTGDPKKADFRFCGHPVERGMRYCAKHRELAYQNPNKKKEEEEELQRQAQERAQAETQAEAQDSSGSKVEKASTASDNLATSPTQ